MNNTSAGGNRVHGAGVARHVLPYFQSVAQALPRVLGRIEEPAPLIPELSRDEHKAAAVAAAENVALQFTGAAKKQAKRECLGHLIASLQNKPEGGDK